MIKIGVAIALWIMTTVPVAWTCDAGDACHALTIAELLNGSD